MSNIHFFIFVSTCVYFSSIGSSLLAYKRVHTVAETVCALLCHIDRDCFQYLYEGDYHLSSKGWSNTKTYVAGKCLLINQTQFDPNTEPHTGMFLKSFITEKNVTYAIGQISYDLNNVMFGSSQNNVPSDNTTFGSEQNSDSSDNTTFGSDKNRDPSENITYGLGQNNHTTAQDLFAIQARAKGFNKSINVGSETILLREVYSNDTFDEAMFRCFSLGGILPMEETDEFVDQMSILAGDPKTPRFISLGQEVPVDNGPKSLVWTLGKVVWTEGNNISKCRRCTNWTFKKFNRQGATINPMNKMYENIWHKSRTSKYFCQFLGANLATHKRVITSSNFSQTYSPKVVVDGKAFEGDIFWQSGNTVSEGEWISVDLGEDYRVSRVLFLGRLDGCWNSYRNQMIQVWIGGPEPEEGAAFNISGRRFCGLYPFQQYDTQLSGVTCPSLILGRFVTVLNSPIEVFLQISELAVFGEPSKL